MFIYNHFCFVYLHVYQKNLPTYVTDSLSRSEVLNLGRGPSGLTEQGLSVAWSCMWDYVGPPIGSAERCSSDLQPSFTHGQRRPLSGGSVVLCVRTLSGGCVTLHHVVYTARVGYPSPCTVSSVHRWEKGIPNTSLKYTT